MKYIKTFENFDDNVNNNIIDVVFFSTNRDGKSGDKLKNAKFEIKEIVFNINDIDLSKINVDDLYDGYINRDNRLELSIRVNGELFKDDRKTKGHIIFAYEIYDIFPHDYKIEDYKDLYENKCAFAVDTLIHDFGTALYIIPTDDYGCNKIRENLINALKNKYKHIILELADRFSHTLFPDDFTTLDFYKRIANDFKNADYSLIKADDENNFTYKKFSNNILWKDLKRNM